LAFDWNVSSAKRITSSTIFTMAGRIFHDVLPRCLVAPGGFDVETAVAFAVEYVLRQVNRSFVEIPGRSQCIRPLVCAAEGFLRRSSRSSTPDRTVVVLPGSLLLRENRIHAFPTICHRLLPYQPGFRLHRSTHRRPFLSGSFQYQKTRSSYDLRVSFVALRSI